MLGQAVETDTCSPIGRRIETDEYYPILAKRIKTDSLHLNQSTLTISLRKILIIWSSQNTFHFVTFQNQDVRKRVAFCSMDVSSRGP
jgi:hypothetical protein